MSAYRFNDGSILDIPEEILIEIILYLNALERAALGNSCKIFNRIVFGKKKLLRELDFSEDVHLASESVIQQYFGSDCIREHIRKVNISYVNCLEPRCMLKNYIAKANYLVDINIHGMQLKSVKQLAYFLKPLIHLQRLSFDWTKIRLDDNALCCKVVEKLFSGLIYLSVRIWHCSYLKEVFRCLQMCQELKELHVAERWNDFDDLYYKSIDAIQLKKLENLEIIEFLGPGAKDVKGHFVRMLQNPAEWMDFQVAHCHNVNGFYLEKNVQICKELLESKWIESIPLLYNCAEYDLGQYMIAECLLNEVIKIAHENVPEKLDCLSPSNGETCILKIDEAKLLLENPRYQISYLNMNYTILPESDVHLLASAFPNLTELVLCDIMKCKETTTRTQTEKRLIRKGLTSSEEHDESPIMNSSFKMLVENTPHVRDLTLYARYCDPRGSVRWDLAALHQISNWKSLRSLRLVEIPINNAKFLIEIGKQCIHLEKLDIGEMDVPLRGSCMTDLLEMLNHCRNLKDLTMEWSFFDVSKLFTSLANNPQLKRVCVTSFHFEADTVNVISSVQQMLQQCSNLTTLVLRCDSDEKELISALRRFKRELNRPNLQYQVQAFKSDADDKYEMPDIRDTVRENVLLASFPCCVVDASYSCNEPRRVLAW